MIRKLLSTSSLLIFIVTSSFAQIGQGALKGKVLDKESGDPLPFVNVVLEMNGNVVTGAASDFDGKFNIKPIPPGTYNVKATFTGYKPMQISGVVINSDKITFQDIKMGSTAIDIKEFEVIEYTVPLISKDNTSSGSTVTKENISQMAARDATSIASTVGGVYSKDDGKGDINVRGARADANYYYIDGIKVRGSNLLPKSSIEQVTVITGGVPAQYGDVTGGVINITTRGASKNYAGSIDYSTSGYNMGDYNMVGLDKFGFNLLEFSLGGPILTKKDSTGEKTEPLVGFFLAGNVTHIVDENPSAIGYYKVNDDVMNQINNEPLRFATNGSGTFMNHEFVRMNDIEKINTTRNGARKGFTLSGKIDVNTSKSSNLTVGGSMDFNTRNRNIWDYSMFNSHNNPVRTEQAWRVYSRFTQRFGSNDPSEEQKSASIIKNAFYTIQADYSKTRQLDYSDTHKDRFFDYGYLGKFKTYQNRFYNFGIDSLTGWQGLVQETFVDTLIGFEVDTTINPYGAKFTQAYYDLFGWEGYDSLGNPMYDYELAGDHFVNLVNVQTNGGALNGQDFDWIYGTWYNPANVFNYYGVEDRSQFRISANGSADIKDHAIMVGFEYEQRVDRSFEAAPRGLWTAGRLYTNNHITNLDRDHPTFEWFGTYPTVSYERQNAAPDSSWGGSFSGADPQYFFDYNLRKSLGLDPDGTDWIDFDNYGPETFDLSFFSADELLNQGSAYVRYYGYDHHGNKLKKDPNFDDFFKAAIDGNDNDGDGSPDKSAWDIYGNSLRGVGAFRPIYVAGFIQDKFAFDDLVFNVGVRVDRYDANQKVLKDPYVLFPTIKAGETDALDLAGEDGHPGNIQDDWVVYVDNIQSPTSILGYRDNDTWYNVEGAELDGPDPLMTATGISPLLVDKERINSVDITAEAFEDYTPQTNFMPRIAFSFPISDEALFSAHYDVLTKRPTTGSRLDPLEYYFLKNRSTPLFSTDYINNPNLKPEKTIDYEVGFQQKLNNTSSLKIAAFYRELRDMVQLVNVPGSFPGPRYGTFRNIDFGTVKGMTFTYDLRRTGNVWMKASYTLQFAEGTGSDATAGLNLIRANKANLRSNNPLSFDQRHTIITTIDYRYGEDKEYNGPILMGKQLFANTGANIVFNAGSGIPYSQQRNISGRGFIIPVGGSILDGKVNGSRLPWQFRMDMKIDRNIDLTWGGAEDGTGAKTGGINVYFQILNVLNTMNVIQVHRATGNPDDDGYLEAAQYANDIRSTNDEQSFRDLYGLKMNEPGHYSLPRRLRVGVLFNF